MAWKNVQYENGKFKTSPGGGGGASAFADLDDVSFDNLQNGQVAKYNSTTGKWENANESGGGGTVTDVEVDGVSVVNQQGVAEITMPTPPTIPVTDVKVNGTSVVDGNNEAQIKSYKELTQAEYNALPASKTSDGVLYCIKDAGGADGFPPLIYSLEEREIGVWTDGKPLYQKTIDIGSLPNNTSKTITTPNNIEHIVKYEGFCYGTQSGQYERPIPLSGGGTNDIRFDLQDGSLRIVTYNSWNGYVGFVTIFYTKTTDIAGSGTWTTDGTYAHHYSTSEKVIGTWIDGKPLYECCYTFENINGIGSGDTDLWSIGNDKFIIPGGLVGIMINTNDDTQYTLPWDGNGNRDNALLYQKSTGKIVLRVKNDSWNNNWHYIYILARYTKTTD